MDKIKKAAASGVKIKSNLGEPGKIQARNTIKTPNTKGAEQNPTRNRDRRGIISILG